jgi:hypothetical protein
MTLGAILGAGVAGAAIRDVVVPRGQTATFAGTHWFCLNGGQYSPNAISCGSGDAHPFVNLSKRAINVTVFSLRRPCAKRVLRPSPDPSDPQMRPYYEYIYTFKAIGKC